METECSSAFPNRFILADTNTDYKNLEKDIPPITNLHSAAHQQRGILHYSIE